MNRIEVRVITSKDILAINLKYFRYQSKLSQEAFAEALSISYQYEYQIEEGKRNPTLKLLDLLSTNISSLLNIKVTSADLITYDKNKIIRSKRIDSKK